MLDAIWSVNAVWTVWPGGQGIRGLDMAELRARLADVSPDLKSEIIALALAFESQAICVLRGESDADP